MVSETFISMPTSISAYQSLRSTKTSMLSYLDIVERGGIDERRISTMFFRKHSLNQTLDIEFESDEEAK